MNKRIKDLSLKKANLPNQLIYLNLDSDLLLPMEERSIIISNIKDMNLVDSILQDPRRFIAILPKRKKKILSEIGCVAKIKSFVETEEGTYVINIIGICRFHIDKIALQDNKLNQVLPIWHEFLDDLDLAKQKITDRKYLNDLTYNYFSIFYQKYDIDFHRITEIPDDRMVSLLTTNVNYDVNNHQNLLEAKNLDDISRIFQNIMEAKVAEYESRNQIKH